MNLKSFFLIGVLFSVNALAGNSPYAFPEIAQAFVRNPNFQRFSVCSHIGCPPEFIRTVGLQPAQVQVIRNLFLHVTSPQQERAAISVALGFFEHFVGSLKSVDTAFDRAGNESPWSFGKLASRQIDCIAESHTAASYLVVLQNEGLLRFHSIASIVQRGSVLWMTQHYAPRLVDRTNGTVWSVDTWLLHNAYPAFVMPFEHWIKGDQDKPYLAETLARCVYPLCTLRFD